MHLPHGHLSELRRTPYRRSSHSPGPQARDEADLDNGNGALHGTYGSRSARERATLCLNASAEEDKAGRYFGAHGAYASDSSLLASRISASRLWGSSSPSPGISPALRSSSV